MIRVKLGKSEQQWVNMLVDSIEPCKKLSNKGMKPSKSFQL